MYWNSRCLPNDARVRMWLRHSGRTLSCLVPGSRRRGEAQRVDDLHSSQRWFQPSAFALTRSRERLDRHANPGLGQHRLRFFEASGSPGFEKQHHGRDGTSALCGTEHEAGEIGLEMHMVEEDLRDRRKCI